MTKKLHGRVHGRTIELDEDPGVVDGQEVELQMKVVPAARKWGEGIRRSAGGWRTARCRAGGLQHQPGRRGRTER